jgi:hypothetical protein
VPASPGTLTVSVFDTDALRVCSAMLRVDTLNLTLWGNPITSWSLASASSSARSVSLARLASLSCAASVLYKGTFLAMVLAEGSCERSSCLRFTVGNRPVCHGTSTDEPDGSGSDFDTTAAKKASTSWSSSRQNSWKGSRSK